MTPDQAAAKRIETLKLVAQRAIGKLAQLGAVESLLDVSMEASSVAADLVGLEVTARERKARMEKDRARMEFVAMMRKAMGEA